MYEASNSYYFYEEESDSGTKLDPLISDYDHDAQNGTLQPVIPLLVPAPACFLAHAHACAPAPIPPK